MTVRVVLESPSSCSSEVSEIENAGTSSAKAFAGSENFSSNSLSNNRELGLITAESGVVSGLEPTFNGDFTGSASGKAAIISPGSMTTAAGTAVNYQVQAIHSATGSLSYSASGLPDTSLNVS